VHLEVIGSCRKRVFGVSTLFTSTHSDEFVFLPVPQYRKTKALGIPTHIDLVMGAAQRLYASCVGKSQHFWVALKHPDYHRCASQEAKCDDLNSPLPSVCKSVTGLPTRSQRKVTSFKASADSDLSFNGRTNANRVA
jgi:hypothetical protein